MIIRPNDRPTIEATKAIEYYKNLAPTFPKEPFFILGFRGFFKKDFGAADNSRAIYDDAIFCVNNRQKAESEALGFNANCDPALYQPGMAVLQPGLYRYEIGTHNRTKELAKQYQALVQYSSVSIIRDGNTEPETGYFGLNIHKGDRLKTASAGCQTIWPEQWAEFMNCVRENMEHFDMKTVYYGLLNF